MKRRLSRKLKHAYSQTYHAFVNTIMSLKDAIVQILAFVGLANRQRRRRNRDFDRAGRETSGGGYVDTRSANNLNKADRVRDLEILAQVQYENRLLRKNNKEAKLLRQAMIEDSLSVSQGEAINHLAEVNRRAKEKQKQDKDRTRKNGAPDKSSPEQPE